MRTFVVKVKDSEDIGSWEEVVLLAENEARAFLKLQTFLTSKVHCTTVYQVGPFREVFPDEPLSIRCDC